MSHSSTFCASEPCLSPSPSSNLVIAQARHDAGLRVLPHAPGDFKQPTFFDHNNYRVNKVKDWKPYKIQAATQNTRAEWWNNPHTGHGIITGEASGGHDTDGRPLILEVLDLDSPPIAQQYLARPDLQDILLRLPLERSHKNKAHVPWKVLADDLPRIPPDLAMRIWNGKARTAIELLSNGQFCVISPGVDYELVRGNWCDVPVITHTERDTLLRAAQEYDERPRGTGSRGERTVATHGLQQGSTPPNLTPSRSPAKTRHATRILTLLGDVTHRPALLHVCGLPETLQPGDPVHCPLHPPDLTPSASFVHLNGVDGILCYHHTARPRDDDGTTRKGTFYNLTTLYRWRISGTLSTGKANPLLTLWSTRLLHAANVLPLARVHVPKVRGLAPPFTQRILETFVDVMRHRYITRDVHDPLPFTWSCCLEWLGNKLGDLVGNAARYLIEKAMAWLIRKGYIVVHPTPHVDADGHTLTLFTLGSRKIREDFQAKVFRTRQEHSYRLESAARRQQELRQKLEDACHPQPQQTQACPHENEPDHTAETCGLCNIRAILTVLENRHDPSGVGAGG